MSQTSAISLESCHYYKVFITLSTEYTFKIIDVMLYSDLQMLENVWYIYSDCHTYTNICIHISGETYKAYINVHKHIYSLGGSINCWAYSIQ